MTIIQSIKLSLFGIKPNPKKILTANSEVTTIVPRSFEKNFKHWDKEKFKNIKYID